MGPISPHIANAGRKAARLSPRRTMWDRHRLSVSRIYKFSKTLVSIVQRVNRFSTKPFLRNEKIKKYNISHGTISIDIAFASQSAHSLPSSALFSVYGHRLSEAYLNAVCGADSCDAISIWLYNVKLDVVAVNTRPTCLLTKKLLTECPLNWLKCRNNMPFHRPREGHRLIKC